MLRLIFFMAFFGMTLSLSAQHNYRFDKDALIDGCGRFALQKRSRDLRHELIVELRIDSLLPSKEYHLDATDRHLKILFNHFPENNCCLKRLCDDVGKRYEKEPIVYNAVSGKIIVTVSPKDEHGRFRVSVVLSEIECRNDNNNSIKLVFETFHKVMVGWYAG